MMYDYFNVFTIFHVVLFDFSDYVNMRNYGVWNMYYTFVSLSFNCLCTYTLSFLLLYASFVTKFLSISANNFLIYPAFFTPSSLSVKKYL